LVVGHIPGWAADGVTKTHRSDRLGRVRMQSLPESVYEALRKIAFEERLKIHDLVLEGIDAELRRRGYPSIDTLRSAKRR
jgi:hypothetical protein